MRPRPLETQGQRLQVIGERFHWLLCLDCSSALIIKDLTVEW